MRRTYFCVIAMVWIVSTLCLQVMGTEYDGKIHIVPSSGGELVYGGTVSIYKLGTETEKGYRVTDGLANWTVSKEEVFSDMFLNCLKQRDTIGKISSILDGQGAVFEGLEDGLYYVKQIEPTPGYLKFKPFLLVIPKGEGQNVYAEPELISVLESPDTGDHAAPIVGAMGLGFSVAVLMVLIDQRKK